MHSDKHHSDGHWRAFAMLGVVMLFWAGNSIVGRAVRDDIPPFTLAFVRWSCASLILLPFAARSVWRDRAALLGSWKIVLLLGVVGIGAFNSLLYESLRFTSATNALLLQASIPPLVLAFDFLFFRSRAPALQGLGVGLSMLGVAAVVFKGDPSAALRLHFGFGDALALGACVVWALYTVLLRLRPKTAPESFVAVTFWIGMLCTGPLAALEWHDGATVHWSAGVFGAFFYVSLFPSLISYFVYNWATHAIGAASAGQAITLMPLFGALLSALLLGEVLYPYHWFGMGLILAGIGLSALALRRKVPAGAPKPAPLEGKP
ncbi:MAG: DMT family transporter [Candidatus Andeanibacterium colombiense]|uniref:DMT family transporter n=1 Tax=Candidatus Andeanibacterium colombiense TaxID=3121345 RepID=A0AAJ5X891_9SPHN|nr:MAG: DMT family transporter [Sphingomonadaceae bacterium]